VNDFKRFRKADGLVCKRNVGLVDTLPKLEEFILVRDSVDFLVDDVLLIHFLLNLSLMSFEAIPEFIVE